MLKLVLVTNIILMIWMTSPLSEVQARSDDNWKKQLEGIQLNETLKEKGYPQLISYIYLSEVKTADEVKQLKEKLLSHKDNYLPLVHEDNGKVELLTLQEIQKTQGEENVSAAMKSLSEFFDHVIQPGVHTVKLTWKLRSKTYESLCVVSDEGILYDSIITNLMITR